MLIFPPSPAEAAPVETDSSPEAAPSAVAIDTAPVVPETLEPGDYLLSWRWDVRCLPALFRCFFLFPLLIFFASRKYVQSVQCGG